MGQQRQEKGDGVKNSIVTTTVSAKLAVRVLEGRGWRKENERKAFYYEMGDFVAKCYNYEEFCLMSESNAPAVYRKFSGETRRIQRSLNEWL